MYTLEYLRSNKVQENVRSIGDVWVPARPVVHGWLARLRDAYQVLKGRADSFTWPGGQ